MIRVLMISDVFFPRVNGESTSIATFRRALSAFDVDVRLLAPRYGDEADAPGIVRIPGRRLPFDPEDRLVRLRAMNAAARREVAARLKAQRPDFVLVIAGEGPATPSLQRQSCWSLWP